MTQELVILVGSAAAIAAGHTLLGPDHYLPFIALSRARRWSLSKTLLITSICGLGHVAGSIVLGAIGIAAGITLRSLELFESSRGEIAAWLLMAFGLAYGVWGLQRVLRRKSHAHTHVHADGASHYHRHTHQADHAHPHDERGRLTPWVLFIVFVLGPCEPLIPLLMYPAATIGTSATILVAAVFGIVTVATMLAIVLVSSFGLSFVSAERLARYSHVLAGATIFLCGVAIRLGL